MSPIYHRRDSRRHGLGRRIAGRGLPPEPLYGFCKSLGWIGTLLPLWLPSWLGRAFHIFLSRQFFRAIPKKLSEAARIDGGGEWTIFWRLILPLSKPVFAVVALFHFLHAWNDFLALGST